jgi:hypothetical protein
MDPMKRGRRSKTGAILFIGAALAAGGCGVIPPPLPDAHAGLTLDSITQIQQDPTLSTQQRRDRIQALLGAELSDSTNRIIDFLLSVMAPAPP